MAPIFINDAISLDFRAQNFLFFRIKTPFFKQDVPLFSLKAVENNENKKSVKFQGDLLTICDFVQVFVICQVFIIYSYDILFQMPQCLSLPD